MYKPYNLSSDEGNYSLGVGRESSNGSFVELTLDRFQNDDGDTFIFPLITIGQKFGEKKLKEKEETIFSEK